MILEVLHRSKWTCTYLLNANEDIHLQASNRSFSESKEKNEDNGEKTRASGLCASCGVKIQNTNEHLPDISLVFVFDNSR